MPYHKKARYKCSGCGRRISKRFVVGVKSIKPRQFCEVCLMDHVSSWLHDFADGHGVTLARLCSNAKPRDLVPIRHEAFRQLRAQGYSTSAIGRVLGVDHSTVVVALRPKKQGFGECNGDLTEVA